MRRGRTWLRAPAFDVTSSFLAVFVMTGLFMLLGAALLHPQHQVPNNADLYGQQAQFLGVVHPALVHVYKAGIFFAMLGAVYGCFEVYARTLFEPVRVAVAQAPLEPQARCASGTRSTAGIGGLLILWTGLRTVTVVTIVSPLSRRARLRAVVPGHAVGGPHADAGGVSHGRRARDRACWSRAWRMALAGAYTTWTSWLG